MQQADNEKTLKTLKPEDIRPSMISKDKFDHGMSNTWEEETRGRKISYV